MGPLPGRRRGLPAWRSGISRGVRVPVCRRLRQRRTNGDGCKAAPARLSGRRRLCSAFANIPTAVLPAGGHGPDLDGRALWLLACRTVYEPVSAGPPPLPSSPPPPQETTCLSLHKKSFSSTASCFEGPVKVRIERVCIPKASVSFGASLLLGWIPALL